jgi:hypothetical protein
VIPLAVTSTVRRRIAPDASPSAANEAVLGDLAGGWTLTAQGAYQRRTHAGGGPFVQLVGRRYAYAALLPGYELPPEWCICPPGLEPCHCRTTPEEGAARLRPAEVCLTGCFEPTPMERVGALRGDRYGDAFALVERSSRVGDPRDDEELRAELEARWMRAQERVLRKVGADATSELWDAMVQLRRAVAESLAAPLRYGVVELDDDGLLLFELADPDTTVAQGVVYQLPGNDELDLSVVELEDGVVRCDPSRDPQGALDYADALRGARRLLVRDQEATSGVLRREHLTMRDYRDGLARNPLLARVIASPASARLDRLSTIDDQRIQPELDDAQEAAVRQALRARDVLVVQGPPGTGKTTFIAELVLRHLRRYPGDTVLVASQTHQAVDNLLWRVHKLDPDLPLVRVVSRRLLERKVRDEVRRFWLDAPEPWVPGVRARAERYRRYARAQVAIGAWGADATEPLLEIQRRYLGTDGAQRTREARLDEARLVAGTCFGVSCDADVRTRTFGLAIVEEAGKATPAEALMAMLPGEKIVLVGDSRQLPPTPDRALDQTLRLAHRRPAEIEDPEIREQAVRLVVELDAARRLIEPRAERPDAYTAETLFAYLGRRLRSERPSLEVTLTSQYRMVSGIGDLISRCFYNDDLANGRDDSKRDPRAAALAAAHVLLDDVAGVEREQADRGAASGSRSKRNKKEADRAIRWLLRLEEKAAALPDVDEGRPLDVAVITGYMAQMRLLRQEVRAIEHPHLRVRVGIVDSFQGDEAEVVILSLVRTDAPGFLRRRNRINVALSRARSLVIVLGALPQARSGLLGKPLQDVLRYVDDRCAARDERYEIRSHRKEGRR